MMSGDTSISIVFSRDEYHLEGDIIRIVDKKISDIPYLDISISSLLRTCWNIDVTLLLPLDLNNVHKRIINNYQSSRGIHLNVKYGLSDDISAIPRRWKVYFRADSFPIPRTSESVNADIELILSNIRDSIHHQRMEQMSAAILISANSDYSAANIVAVAVNFNSSLLQRMLECCNSGQLTFLSIVEFVLHNQEWIDLSRLSAPNAWVDPSNSVAMKLLNDEYNAYFERIIDSLPLSVTERCPARVGLMGNPSDGFRGKTLSFLIDNFSAAVSISSCDRIEIEDPFIANGFEDLHMQSLNLVGSSTTR